MRAWRVASTTSLRDRTDGTYAVSMYFDRLIRTCLGCYSMSPEVTEKLEKARGGERW